MLAAIEKHVTKNIDQVVIDVSFGIRQPERKKGLSLQILRYIQRPLANSVGGYPVHGVHPSGM
jgi:hypothetical protein